jgi:hypothetical protein
MKPIKLTIEDYKWKHLNKIYTHLDNNFSLQVCNMSTYWIWREMGALRDYFLNKYNPKNTTYEI